MTDNCDDWQICIDYEVKKDFNLGEKMVSFIIEIIGISKIIKSTGFTNKIYHWNYVNSCAFWYVILLPNTIIMYYVLY